MGKCCLCGKLEEVKQMSIDSKEYDFCEECIMSINTLEDGESRQYVLDNMKNVEDTVLKEFLDNGIRQGLLAKNNIEEETILEYDEKNSKGIQKIGNIIIATITILLIILGIAGIIFESLQPYFTYKEALSIADSGNYEQAISKLNELKDNYKDKDEKIQEIKYLLGNEHIENKEYDLAIQIFEELNEYKDSKIHLLDCYYNKGIEEYEKGYFEKSKNYFIKSNETVKSAEYLNNIENILQFIGTWKVKHDIEDYEIVFSEGWNMYLAFENSEGQRVLDYKFKLNDKELEVYNLKYKLENGIMKESHDHGETYIYTFEKKSKTSYRPSEWNYSYYCAANGPLGRCTNKITSGTYCSIHKSGKSKKCLQCGRAIYADETWCDYCILGAW